MQQTAPNPLHRQSSWGSRREIQTQPSLRRLGPATFLDIPTDDVLTICSYLGMLDIYRLQMSCKAEAEIGNDGDLWTLLLQRDFAELHSETSVSETLAQTIRTLASRGRREQEAASLRAGAKQAYRSRVEAHRGAVNDKLLQRQRRRDEEQITHRSHMLRVGLDISSFLCGLGAPCALFALWLLLVMLKLNNNIDISWPAVWAPIWLLVVITTLVFVIDVVVMRLSRDAAVGTLWWNQDYGSRVLSIRGIMGWLTENNPSQLFRMKTMYLLSMLSLAFVIFPALILAKLTGQFKGTWHLVFVPLWLLFAGWCCIPWAATTALSVQERKKCFFLSLFLWLPIVVVCLILVFRLEGAEIRLASMLLPFWFLDFFWGGGFILSVVAFFFRRRERGLFWLSVALGLPLGLGITSMVLGSISDANGRVDVIGFMAPMVAAASAAAVGACVLAVRLLRRERQNSFTESWEYVARHCCRCRRVTRPPVLPGADT
jgi:hypothetical protein